MAKRGFDADLTVHGLDGPPTFGPITAVLATGGDDQADDDEDTTVAYDKAAA